VPTHATAATTRTAPRRSIGSDPEELLQPGEAIASPESGLKYKVERLLGEGGFGQVYLEALAHGCPVLGTANTGLPDLGSESDGVFLVEPGNVTELAAKLANEECERLYSKRPFKATQHKAVLEGDSYRWGRLDPGGPGGLSAVVTFRADGSQPDVKVYLSTDITKRR